VDRVSVRQWNYRKGHDPWEGQNHVICKGLRCPGGLGFCFSLEGSFVVVAVTGFIPRVPNGKREMSQEFTEPYDPVARFFEEGMVGGIRFAHSFAYLPQRKWSQPIASWAKWRQT
jgi:hypothetical protein